MVRGKGYHKYNSKENIMSQVFVINTEESNIKTIDNGLAIDKGIHMAYHPKQNGIIELQSLNFPKRAQFL